MTLSESLTEQAFEVFRAEMQRLFRMSPHAEPGDLVDAQRSAVAAVVEFAQAERVREVVEWLRRLAAEEDKDHARMYLDPGYWADAIVRRFGSGER